MRISDEHRELMARVRPVGIPETPCSECTPDVNGNEIAHSADCAVSLDVEAVLGSDGEWFDAHPAADFFYREISWGESAQLVVRSDVHAQIRTVLPEARITPAGRVRVERFQDGIRIRRFEDVYFVVEG